MKIIGLLMFGVVVILVVVLLRAPEAKAPVSSGSEEALPEVTSVSDPRQPSGPMITVYDGIRASANSTSLDVSGQGLTGSLKAEIRQLTALEVLDVSDNQFTGLPAEIGQLSQLRILNLANNPITGLPYELGNLQRLETLDLRGTDYATADLEVIKQSLSSSTKILVDENED